MPASSPQLDAEGVVRVSVSANGSALAEVVQLISLTVTRAVNTVPSARLVFADGDMPEKTFPVSDSADFKPGAAIKVSAGYGDGEETLFEGIIVKHALKVSGNNDARLVVEWPKVKASWVALVTHELSHAHDHVVKAREVRTPVRAGVEGHTKDVIETELRAWAREALSAHKISPKDLDAEKRELREGWQGIKTDMLQDLAAYAAANAVIGRLLRYAQRELKKKVNSNDPDVSAQEWADRHRAWLEGEVTRLRDALAKQW